MGWLIFGNDKKQNRVAMRESGFRHPVAAFILIFPFVSLTTLSKIVTYTPYPCPSSVQYASECGRRVIPKFRRLADKKAVFAELAARVLVARYEALPNYFKRLTYLEDPELAPNFLLSIISSAVTPLRSPPLIQNRAQLGNT